MISKIVDDLVNNNLCCLKCLAKKYEIRENPFTFGDIAKIFTCNSCGHTKDISFKDLYDFNVKAENLVNEALAGDFAYTNNHTIKTLIDKLLTDTNRN